VIVVMVVSMAMLVVVVVVIVRHGGQTRRRLRRCHGPATVDEADWKPAVPAGWGMFCC